jgi:hypothetical protein
MGEFQCYQFKCIDRPLSESERREVGALSSRGQVTSHSATFIYHYSDFRHKPEDVLEKYFDAMIYFANWGTRRLLLRLPVGAADVAALAAFEYDEDYGEKAIRLKRRSKYYILEIELHDEGGGYWMEDDDYDVGDMAPLCNDILNGDYRSLYLAWASFAQDAEMPQAPPLPANLKRLTSALKAFIDFFQIDGDLVAAVQAASPDERQKDVNYPQLLAQLSEKERIDWLSRLLAGEPRLEMLLKKRLQQLAPQTATPASPALSAAQIRKLAAKEEKKREAREQAEARAAHEKRMKELASEENALWESVAFNLERKSAKSYDIATATLKDLQALAVYQSRQAAFREKMEELQSLYARRWALIKQWEEAGLLGEVKK